jgi:NADH-quinone oxidoreductase subunit M
MERLLVLLITLPFAAAAVAALAPRRLMRHVLWMALTVALAELALSGYLLVVASAAEAVPAVALSDTWMPELQVHLEMTVDAVSAAFICVTALITCVGLACALAAPDPNRRQTVCAMVLCGAAMGLYSAADMVSFLVFFELAALPAYGLARGGAGDSDRTALRLLVQSALGGAALLLTALVLAEAHRALTGTLSFSLSQLSADPLPDHVQWWVLLGVGAAMMLRMGAFPCHVALATALRGLGLVEAMLLLGCWIPTGAYGLLRLWSPLSAGLLGHWSLPWQILAVAGVGYSGLVALVQTEPEQRLSLHATALACCILLGAATPGVASWTGGLLLALSLGPATGVLALLTLSSAGTVTPTAAGSDTPWRAPNVVVTRVAGLFCIGLPGSGIFTALVLILAAVGLTRAIPAAVALTGLALLGVALLRDAEPPRPEARGWCWRHAMALPLVALLVALGTYPQPAVDTLTAAAGQMLSHAEQRRAAAAPAEADTTVAEPQAGAR